MRIDQNKLNEVFVYNPRPTFEINERWYSVPNDSRYALSTSGRLAFSHDGKREFRILYPAFVNGNDGYNVKFKGNKKEEFKTISELIGEVFFSDVDYYSIIAVKSIPQNRGWGCNLNPYKRKEYYSYLVTNCHVVFCKDELDDYFISKCNGDIPNYSEYHYKHQFINRDESATHEKVIRDWHNMMERTIHKESTACESWYDIVNFSSWYYSNRYYYSGAYGDLQLDKDIRTFGQYQRYSADNCCFIPMQINQICRRTGLTENTVETMKQFINDETIREEIPTAILDCCREWVHRFYDEEVNSDE